MRLDVVWGQSMHLISRCTQLVSQYLVLITVALAPNVRFILLLPAPERMVVGEADVFSNQAPVDMTGEYRDHPQPTDPLLPRNPESVLSDNTELGKNLNLAFCIL